MTTTTRPARIKGSTPEERAAARRLRTSENRADYYVHLMQVARWEMQSPKETLRHACDFLRAVAKGLSAESVFELAEVVTRLADERNK